MYTHTHNTDKLAIWLDDPPLAELSKTVPSTLPALGEREEGKGEGNGIWCSKGEGGNGDGKVG